MNLFVRPHSQVTKMSQKSQRIRNFPVKLVTRKVKGLKLQQLSYLIRN